ncbi:Uma2 family endonuclease [Spirosoma sp. KUDC1026]|uniref:Uma2 family endonuclease n=1 Tax=Spirosoma sp. KUDC1026 TaxID=2745947 RepID=UPI00159B9E29|nr:Uma2 family endonuclease [Spirosoma sp. KUDC1026]QKZ12700.1 Uma2 family endonuclease [Spirosoma sp. KUDC1026]
MQAITLTIPPNINVFSDDELYAFCLANPELRIERDETGHIIIMPPTGLESSFTNGELFGEVRNWNRRTKAGRTSESNGGYTLPDTSMRAPDVGWVSKERLMQVVPDELKKFARVCPDFVIEVRSESDSLKELQTKMEKWLKNGVRLGWLVDPQEQKTTIYRPDSETETKLFSETLSGEDVLVGFTMNIQEVLTY